MECVLGIDLGTSSVKVAALGTDGSIIKIHGTSYPILHPEHDYAEQNPVDWWSATRNSVRTVLSSGKPGGLEVRSVGFSGQMHGLVLVDDQLRPLRNAIIWPDRRSAEICREWEAKGYAETFYPITGLPPATGFMAPSLEWVRRNEPDIYRRARYALLPKDYLRSLFIGAAGTEATDATGTYLFDVVNRTWSAQILSTLGLRDDLLPPITSTREIAGTVQPPAARETGIPAGTPVIAGGSDQAMAATALQADLPGTVAVAISTGGTVITTVKAPVTDRRIHTFCHVENDSWLTLGATLSAGASLSWFQRILSTGSNQDSGEPAVDFETISRWVSSTSPGADGLFFAPFLNGERTPHMDPDARGCFIGLNLSHTTAHLARAVMEGVVYSLHESFSIFREYQLPIDRVIAYAGGSRSAVWRQILADVIDRPVAWNSATDVSAIGAALLAGHGAGFKPEYSAGTEPELTYPDPRSAALYRERVKVFRRMYQHLSPIFRDITSFQS